MTRFEDIHYSIAINAPLAKIWEYLTIPSLMKTWMLDQDTHLDIYSDWQVGSPIVMKGKLHQVKIENWGTILEFEPEKRLTYTHLSSISHLPDEPESYCKISFELSAGEEGNIVALTITNFPTESIYKHLDFYWRATLGVLKEQVEQDFVTFAK